MKTNAKGKQVCVVIGATSKWQSDGRNTLLAHGHAVDDSDVEVGVRWGVCGAIAQKFAVEGFFTVLTTRREANAAPLAVAIREQGGDCMIVELDLVSQDSIKEAFATIRREAGDPEVLIYNAGYLAGRDPRYGSACLRPRPVPRRTGSLAGDAQERPRLVLLFEQFLVAAREEAD